jgi:hypothetical protein
MNDNHDDTAIQQDASAADTMIETARATDRQSAERFGDHARRGARLAGEASETGTQAMARAGSSLAGAMQGMSSAWAQYAEEVMRQTTDASRALFGCRSLAEVFEVQSRFLHGNMRAFLDHSCKLADLAGQMAKGPFEALQQATSSRAAWGAAPTAAATSGK